MAFPPNPASLVTFPRVVSIGDPAGFSLTRAEWQSTTPDILQAENTIQYGESNALRLATEARLVGVVPNTLMELVNSRMEGREIATLQETKVQGQPASIEPYKYRVRNRQMRMSWFNIFSATADPAAGTTDANGVVHPTSAWKLSINLGTAQFATQFQTLSRFFQSAGALSVDWIASGTASTVAFPSTRVVMSILQGTGLVVDLDNTSCTVIVYAPVTDAAWASMTTAQKAPFKPTCGTVTPISNNVSDWESYATNAPVNLGMELLTDWVGTTRAAYATNDLYLQGLKDIADNCVNDVVKKFQALPITEIVKQQMDYWQRVELNAMFYSARIDLNNQVDNPTRANILALPTVLEHEDGNVLDRKANPIGIITQLEEQGQVYDFAGAPLNLNAVFDILWLVRRNRQVDGKDHDTIDLLMNRFDKLRIDTALLAYLRAQYGFDTTQYVTQGKTLDAQGMVMFTYTTYDLPLQQMKVALISHTYFEDKKSAFQLGTGGPQGTVNLTNLGNEIWAIDWSDIKIGVIATNEVSRDYRNDITAQADPFYAKCMKLNTKHYRLVSRTRCVEFGDFERHSVFRNYSNAAPILNYNPASGLTHS